MVKSCDLSDFDKGKIVGAKQVVWVLQKQDSELNNSHTSKTNRDSCWRFAPATFFDGIKGNNYIDFP